MLGLLEQNLCSTTQKICELAYFGLVRPHLEYCSTVWSPNNNSHLFLTKIRTLGLFTNIRRLGIIGTVSSKI